MRESKATVYRERAVLVGLLDPAAVQRGRNLRESHKRYGLHRDSRSGGPDPADAEVLHELESLADTAGAEIVGRLTQRREKPHPRTFIGPGKVKELADEVRRRKADVVIVDHNLSPGQVRNLERGLETKVIDRTELILDIFATHARTNEAKLQVELAQLKYNLPRLKRMWTHLEKQAGGTIGGLGGIGTRGPGEKQIEVDRRIANKRITDLRREIEGIERRKQREVAGRARENYACSFVGYTNAGKSTLMNRLTEAGVLVDDRLFSTLDTRTRVWKLRTGLKVFLSDTVGFIKNLPHDLVASFHATLEEVTQSDLLLHVVDASHPEAAGQIESVHEVLREIGCGEKEAILVFNKIDRFRDAVECQVLRGRHPEAALVSARTGEGVEDLARRVEKVVTEQLEEMTVEVPVREGRLLAEVGANCVILDRQVLDGEHAGPDGEIVRIRMRAPKRLSHKLAPFRAPNPS